MANCPEILREGRVRYLIRVFSFGKLSVQNWLFLVCSGEVHLQRRLLANGHCFFRLGLVRCRPPIRCATASNALVGALQQFKLTVQGTTPCGSNPCPDCSDIDGVYILDYQGAPGDECWWLYNGTSQYVCNNEYSFLSSPDNECVDRPILGCGIWIRGGAKTAGPWVCFR